MVTREVAPSANAGSDACAQKYGDFRQVSGTMGSMLYVLERWADRNTGVALLHSVGLRPVTYMEILPALIEDEELKTKLKMLPLPKDTRALASDDISEDGPLRDESKSKWFYLVGKGLSLKEEGSYTVDASGGLVKLRKKQAKAISQELKIGVWNGPNWQTLTIDSDREAAACGRRFCLNADCEPDIAPLIVGVPMENSGYVEAAKLLRPA